MSTNEKNKTSKVTAVAVVGSVLAAGGAVTTAVSSKSYSKQMKEEHNKELQQMVSNETRLRSELTAAQGQATELAEQNLELAESLELCQEERWALEQENIVLRGELNSPPLPEDGQEWNYVEPFAITGLDYITFVWALNADKTLKAGFTVPAERVRGTIQSHFQAPPPEGERPSLQQLLMLTNEEVLAGMVGQVDAEEVLNILGIVENSCWGDTTGDGVIDLNDLNKVLANFGTECP